MDTGFLLSVLACPKCHDKLELVENKAGDRGFACKNCAVVYPVIKEIPVMLIEKAISAKKFEEKQGNA